MGQDLKITHFISIKRMWEKWSRGPPKAEVSVFRDGKAENTVISSTAPCMFNHRF